MTISQTINALKRASVALGAIALSVSSGAAAQNAACLSYEPKVVTLRGVIVRHLDYGAPGFGEDPRHDAKERYWRLRLDAPICVSGTASDDPETGGSESGVQQLQIVFMGSYPSRTWIGHHVSMSGTLFHAFTGHHHTQVLIQYESMKRAGSAD